MDISNENIDGGKAFDWGKTSEDYAKFRDIYPPEFYERIIKLGLCENKQHVLDVGTGTGVLPRNMYQYGAKWTGTDISKEQIEFAKMLSRGMDINYCVMSAEELDFPKNSFDVITSCQCFLYFNHEKLAPVLSHLLKPNGCFLVMCMEWLPFEDEIAGASEKLVLKYNPEWSGKNAVMQPMEIPKVYEGYFDLEKHSEYKLKVHFTRESWNGRMKSCRGIGASLVPDKIALWEREHMDLLSKIAPPEFDVLHYAALAVMRVKKTV